MGKLRHRIEVNPNHSLYLHPSDNPGMSLISTKLTGPENYAIWSRAMIVTLRGKNKIDFIYGTFAKDLFKASLHALWQKCNAIVFSWILNSL